MDMWLATDTWVLIGIMLGALIIAGICFNREQENVSHLAGLVGMAAAACGAAAFVIAAIRFVQWLGNW